VDVITTISELRLAIDAHRRVGRTIGFVPTMGYLHDGHVSLVRASVAANDVTVVSIFVNPLQFAPTEDLASYPRDLDRDLALCADAHADLVFAPTVDEMYPEPLATAITVAGLSASMEGATRPDHFGGVATVVTKLFSIVGPSRAYFGEKDWQQLAIVSRMAHDLSLPVEVVGCPIVRESDGLAMSSRNVYLTPAERGAATVLHRALRAGAESIQRGERSPDGVRHTIGAIVASEPLAELDYAEVVDGATLERPTEISGPVRLLVAARFGRPRLLDNLGVSIAPG
jgi:pantoate--beta-alanine ligase